MRTLLLATVAAGWAVAASAQQAPAANDVWIIELESPTRQYAVRLGSVQTVTLQEYDKTKGTETRRVVEMTIETNGGNQARFFWEDKPETATGITGDLQEKRREVEKAVAAVAGGGDDSCEKQKRVQKDYPVTTHTDWAEFKMGTENEIRSLHRQLMQAWSGRKAG